VSPDPYGGTQLQKGTAVSSNPAEMFEITTTMKAGQQPDLARKVRRGWLIAVVLLVVAFVAMGLLLN